MSRNTRNTRYTGKTSSTASRYEKQRKSTTPTWPIVEHMFAAAPWFPSWTAMATVALLLAVDADSDAEAHQLQVIAQGIESIGHFTSFDLDWTDTMYRALAADGRLSKLRTYFYGDRVKLMDILVEFDLDEIDDDRLELRAERQYQTI
jgi:hypothetical protein